MGKRLRGSFSQDRAIQRYAWLGLSRKPDGYWPGQYTGWMNTIFPTLPVPPEPPVEPKKRWPADARAIAKSLLRTDTLANLQGGLRIEQGSEYFEIRRGKLSSKSDTLALVSPDAWLTRTESFGSQILVNFCDKHERGVLSEAFLLGRLRESTPEDIKYLSLGLEGYVLSRLDYRYQGYSVEVKPQGDDRMLLVLTNENNPTYEIHILIDTARHVMLSFENHTDGKVTARTQYSDFVEVAGAWWAGRIEWFSADGKRTGVVTQKFTALAADAFRRQLDQALAIRRQVQLLEEPAPSVIAAKRAIATGKASFDDQMTMLLYFAERQLWPRVDEHLAEAERLAGDKPGMRFLRTAVLNVSRRHEEVKQRILAEAEKLADGPADDPNALFLANYLYGQASATQQANEMLALLDQLKPIYERQPEHLHAMLQWTRNRINYLRSAGQNDEALRLARELAEWYPLNYQAQQQYAQALVNMGDYPAALEWLADALADKEARWLPYEEEQLRNTYANFLWNQGRYGELIEFTAEWVDRDLPNSSAYNQRLSALIRSDRVDEADVLLARWLQQGRKPGKLTPQEVARMQAAINHALGQGHQVYTNRLEEKWLEPLAETVVFFADHETQTNLADLIMNNWKFQQSDACRRVRKQIAGKLVAQIETLRPDRISRFIGWIWPNDPEIEQAVWKRIADVLQKRWSAEEDIAKKHQLGVELSRVLSGRMPAAEHLAFLRQQLQQGPKENRVNYVQQLFDALLVQPWSAEHEDEAFSLLPKLSEAEEPAVRLAASVQGLYRLTDRMVEARYDAAMQKVERPEELTRTELREKQIENRRTAREQLADRLRKEMGQCDDAMVPWLNVERLYLDVQAGRELEKVAEECWEMLGAEPNMIDTDDPNEAILQGVLKQRCLMTLANLAARRTATPALIERLLGYIDRAIELAAEEDDDDATADFAWKLLKWRLLVALDRPAELEKNLKRWLGVDDPNNHWRRSYGYLLAEQGKLAEAIRQFEAIETDDELSPQDYRALAGWYMVVNQREKHEQALVEVFKATDEWRLSDWLYQRLRPWQRNEGEMPTEIDPDVLRVFAALFQKAQHPSNHLGRLREFYQATRDFRLLAGLADGMIGHTAGKVYPFLQGMDSVLDEIRDEATADSLIEHLVEVRRRAETAVDHRALDLLEVQVERRSSEVLNQPGPHVARALAAMRRAFERKWSDGEPRLMADFLADLGRISQQELADEQLREARILHEGAEEGTIDRLHIAHRRAQCIWYYQRHDEAIDLLEAALDEFEDACDGVLPTDANGPLETFISFLEQRNHFARAEAFLLEQLKHPVHQQQVYWLTQRLYRSYNRAIGSGGDVSLGSGIDLYRAIERKIRNELDTPDHDHRYQLVNILCDIYRTSKRKGFDGVADDLRDFGFKQLPDVLGVQTTNYQSIVGQVASTLHDVASPRDGLAFLIERLENEPSWFRYNNQDGWNQHGYSLAHWRTQAGELGDLEPRLLAIVLKELRRDLESRQSRNRNMYGRHYTYYWKEKENDFARTADEVYAERKQSGASVQYIATYLFNDLDHHDRAIEMLLIAEKEEILDESGRWRLVDFLHRRDRYGESIPVLQSLVKRYPDNMNYRVYLMRAYFKTARPAELLALLEATDKYFHEEGRWQESAMAALAHSCLENQLYEQSVEYYKELIPLHQRTQPRRGIGNGTLSSYYTWLADAYAGLGNTVDAVDAACGAVISWGPTHKNRADALRGLQRVLRNSPDLDAYVVELDKQCEEDNTENPIVRKALGMVYFEQGKYDKAITQLQLACQAQPNDTETHQKLIACYDEQNDKQGALRQLLASVQLSRRDINLYRDLGQRYSALKQSEDAERAHTSIVEMLPNESESHAMLAEIRQNQDRWLEAIAHWKQVAEIRSLEPTGLLKLAAAQIHEKRFHDAAETVKRLRARSWPSRFGDVDSQIRKLERQIDDALSAMNR